MIEHPPNISDLPIWRKILLACSLAFFVFVFVAGIDKHLTIYGSAPDHPVAETGQIYSVSVMHGYIRYVTLRERESYLLWAGSAGSWAGAAFVLAFLLRIIPIRKAAPKPHRI
jgi:hypothetical protein